MQVAIIGAGLAGLTAARQCQAQGHHVTVYEKSRGVSGRMCTRQTEFGGFDFGAQYFTASSERFKKEVNDWCKLEWVTAWDSELVTIAHGKVQESKEKGKAPQRFVPIPGMNALGKQLAHGLDVRLEQQVIGLSRHGEQWLLSVKSDEVPVPATAGPFDAVLVAIPAEQAAVLLKDNASFAQTVSKIHMQPCWALMLAFQNPLNLPYDGAWVEDSRLAWIARDTSKPEHRAGERWVCHASAAWSTEHLEDEHERVKEKLVKAFHEATGSPVQAIHAEAHRWRFSLADQPLTQSHLWDAKEKIGVCGDWFSAGLEGAGRVENAFLSGLALSKELG